MRTTLTLDPDVAAQLKQRATKTGLPFRQVVNQAIRAGLQASGARARRKRFTVKASPLRLRPGLSYDNLSELIALGEGEDHK